MYIDIVYETENAIFQFLLSDVKACLSYYAYEHGVEKAKRLIHFMYPIINLCLASLGVVEYIGNLEEVMIRAA